MIKFVILSFPRTGSTFLCSLLGSHPDILCHFEVFHPLEIVTIKDFNQLAEKMRSFTPRTRDENPGLFLKTLFKYSMGRRAIGFKIFVDHSKEAHDIILKDSSIKKIILKRNTIDSYTSAHIAKKTGAFTHKGMPSGASQTKILFNVKEFLKFDWKIGEYISGLERSLRESGQNFLEVRYEDMISNERVVDSIFSFLEIERGDSQLYAFTHKQNKSQLSDKIENLEEAFRDMTSLVLKLTKTDEENIRSQEELISNLRFKLESSEQRLQDIHKSLSWKLIKPLRIIRQKFS